MKNRLKLFTAAGITLGMLTGPACAQWSQANLEQVTTGPENDHLGYSSLALDNAGTLHLLYDRWAGSSNHDFYYRVKPLGGSWTYNVSIGDSSASLLSPSLALDPTTDTAYAIFLQNGALRLGIGNLASWAYYDLPVPGSPPLFHPALAVDPAGRAHIAFILQNAAGYYLGYGYWDGSFHFQIIANSELGPFGSGASPDICATSDGGVAISYRAGTYGAYRVDVAENFSLGMTNWQIQTVSQQDYQCYESSIQTAPSSDNLYLAFSGDLGWGFPGHVFFTSKPDGATQWIPPTDVTGAFSGVAPKLAMTASLVPHILFEERSGNILTGNICYATNLSGSWAAQYLQQGDKYNPSLVMDGSGNGSMCFEQYVGSGNQDIFYYGYVEGLSPLPNVTVTLTPINPPITIPAGGGSFSFTANLQNNSDSAAVVDIWTKAILPNGNPYGPIINFQNLNLPGNGSRSRTFQQFVPAAAPAGNYLYVGYAGNFPNGIASADTFAFRKLGAQDWGREADDWTFQEIAGALPSQSALTASPNPFNPSTTVRYQLTANSYVNLKVYDIAGRLVQTLVDGWREAGEHEVTFDGKESPSGIYVCRIRIGDWSGSEKMILLK